MVKAKKEGIRINKGKFIFGTFRLILAVFGVTFATTLIHEYVHIKQSEEPLSLCLDLGNFTREAYVQGNDFNTIGVYEKLANKEPIQSLVYFVYGEGIVDEIEYEARIIDSITFIGLLLILLIGEFYYRHRVKHNNFKN